MLPDGRITESEPEVIAPAVPSRPPERPLPPPSEETMRLLVVFRELREVDLEYLRTVLLPQLEGLVDAEQYDAQEAAMENELEISNQHVANANEGRAVLRRVELYLRNVEPGLREQAEVVRADVRAAAGRLGVLLEFPS